VRGKTGGATNALGGLLRCRLGGALIGKLVVRRAEAVRDVVVVVEAVIVLADAIGANVGWWSLLLSETFDDRVRLRVVSDEESGGGILNVQLSRSGWNTMQMMRENTVAISSSMHRLTTWLVH
jgi:hypothetical protein